MPCGDCPHKAGAYRCCLCKSLCHLCSHSISGFNTAHLRILETRIHQRARPPAPIKAMGELAEGSANCAKKLLDPCRASCWHQGLPQASGRQVSRRETGATATPSQMQPLSWLNSPSLGFLFCLGQGLSPGSPGRPACKPPVSAPECCDHSTHLTSPQAFLTILSVLGVCVWRRTWEAGEGLTASGAKAVPRPHQNTNISSFKLV
jgi:hypothetical protein